MTAPEDRELSELFASLDPDAARLSAIGRRVLAEHQLDESSLAAEWVELLKARPANLGYVGVAAAAMLLFSPLGSLMLRLLGGLGA